MSYWLMQKGYLQPVHGQQHASQGYFIRSSGSYSTGRENDTQPGDFFFVVAKG